MKKTLMCAIMAFGSLFFTVNPLLAQGTAFTYQGQLNDGGLPANGSYDLTFSLFTATNGGVAVDGPLTNLATAVSGGLFSVTLDYGAGVFNGSNYWLQIGVRTNGAASFVTLAPRQSVTPSPYAIYAPNAGSVAAANVMGVLGAAQLPGNVLTNGASGANLAAGSVGTAQLASGAMAAPASAASTNITMAPNASYVATNASGATFALPATANLGDVVQVSATGAGGWRVTGTNIVGTVIIPPPWALQTNSLNGGDPVVASSSDGTHLVVIAHGGGIYTSVNSGTNWALQTSGITAGPAPDSVASSSDGTHLVAGVTGGGIYTSVNSGTNWALQSIGLPGSAAWYSVASSSDGTHLVAVVSAGGIYTSVNSGTNWALQTGGYPAGAGFPSVASSSDGTHLVTVAYDGGIYTSANSGTNWAKQTNGLPGNEEWSSVASSSDGTHLVAVVIDGGLYTSANSGTNWAQQTNGLPSSAEWDSIASSSDGTHLVAVASAGGIYTSVSGGTNWVLQTNGLPASDSWFSVASSSDGSHLVAADTGGAIYTWVYGPEAVAGSQGSSEQFQYAGNGVWQEISPSGNVALLSANQTFTGQNNFAGTLVADNSVGIGTSSPNYPLEVNGNIALDSTHLVFNNTAACVDVGAGGTFYWRVDDTTGNIGTYTTPMTLTAAGNLTVTGTVSPMSDRNAKKNFAPVNAQSVLAQVAALPITRWEYKADSGIEHLGPMAQDFHAAFGLNGPDDKHITTTDEEGVALAAIQGLNQKLEDQAKAMNAKDAEIQELKRRLDALEKRMAPE
jgi:photosystem II stability/assembly factor-like uncharacterized protein